MNFCDVKTEYRELYPEVVPTRKVIKETAFGDIETDPDIIEKNDDILLASDDVPIPTEPAGKENEIE